MINRDNKTVQIKRVGSSYRDPSGFVFYSDGVLYRQINQRYREHYERLMKSGLYDSLTQAGLLISHHETSQPTQTDDGYLVIQPEIIPFISYPYEWCFGELQAAAFTTLALMKQALQYGLILKDSSVYNIQFKDGRPICIDSLSFEIYQPGQPWIAYRQFCEHFFGPLSVMAYRDVRLGQLLRVFLDGLPLDFVQRLLPVTSRFKLPLLTHIHAHASSQKRYQAKTVKTKSGSLSLRGLLALIENLEVGIRSLRWQPPKTVWGDYQTNYSARAKQSKQTIIAAFIEHVRPATVWDFGANDGTYSRLASQTDAFTVAFDSDYVAVEKNYRTVVEHKEKNLLPLYLDLVNPTAPLGWHNNERLSLAQRGPVSLVMALALIHHLAIGHNLPLDFIARYFSDCGAWLIAEFIPKSDSNAQRLLAAREDIFQDYTQNEFERAFSKYYKIEQRRNIDDSERVLYLMKKR